MDIEKLRRYCLSLPHATEGIQWGSDLLFRIGGKMFAVVALERTPISIAAYARFLAGMQAAGARVQENSDLRLRLVFSVIQGMTSTTSEAPAGVEAAHRIESTNSGYRGRPSWRVPNISAEPHRGGPGPGQTGCRDQAGGG